MRLSQHSASSRGDHEDEAIATVIPLVQPDRAAQQGGAPGEAASDPAEVPEADELARAEELLHQLAGSNALDLPTGLGRAAARAEWLLAEGPCAIDSAASDPAEALDRASLVVAASRSLLDLILEEVEVLSEAIAAELTVRPVSHLHEIADAVLELSTASPAAPHWGDPMAADAAELVLEVLAEDLRDAARAHESLYSRFTEAIWQVPGPLLRAGRRRWRLIARARLRRLLRGASRTDRVGSIAATAKEVLDVRAARDRVDALAPLLAHHLGALDAGPMSDVDGALVPLRAVRRLQAALGGAFDSTRMQQLLLADAFRTHDVSGPALRIRNAVRAWHMDLLRAGVPEEAAIKLDELSDWVIECADTVPSLAEGRETAASVGIDVPTLRALVDLLVLREHVEDLAQSEISCPADHAESAS